MSYGTIVSAAFSSYRRPIVFGGYLGENDSPAIFCLNHGLDGEIKLLWTSLGHGEAMAAFETQKRGMDEMENI